MYTYIQALHSKNKVSLLKFTHNIVYISVYVNNIFLAVLSLYVVSVCECSEILCSWLTLQLQGTSNLLLLIEIS